MGIYQSPSNTCSKANEESGNKRMMNKEEGNKDYENHDYNYYADCYYQVSRHIIIPFLDKIWDKLLTRIIRWRNVTSQNLRALQARR